MRKQGAFFPKLQGVHTDYSKSYSNLSPAGVCWLNLLNNRYYSREIYESPQPLKLQIVLLAPLCLSIDVKAA